MNTSTQRQTSQSPPWGKGTRGIIRSGIRPTLDDCCQLGTPFLYLLCWTQPQSSPLRSLSRGWGITCTKALFHDAKMTCHYNFQLMNALLTRQTSQAPPWSRGTLGSIHPEACPTLDERCLPTSSPFFYILCWTQPQSSFRGDMPMAFSLERFVSCDHLGMIHSSGQTQPVGFIIFLLHT